MAPSNFILFLTLLVAQSHLARSARSRRRPTAARPAGSRENPTEYDRTITTFNSEGRLLQVEYGSIAAGRGDTVSCFDLDCLVPQSSCKLRGIVVCVVREAKPKSVTWHQLTDKVHRIDHHAILVTSGLTGDSAALADMLRATCLNSRMMNGEHPTLKEIAEAVGSTQHQLTRTDGRRPFGVSAAVIGIDPIPCLGFDSNMNIAGDDDRTANRSVKLPPPGVPTLYRSDPGGTVDRCDYCAIGRGAEKAMGALESIMKGYNSKDNTNEDEGLSTERHILAEVIAKVATAAFNSEGDSPSAEEDNDVDIDDSMPRVLDIWFISTGPKNRGGARFRVARSVNRESMDEASEKLIQ
eukprot:CAMPEP_0181029600 /NCGR_PEP_ID=MMETSP1070-20121207/5281_1 /TAXON_ID=265543 /ORGANISM="Minutocellus polymorphus, Strain NH13" /LENGTH=352 /DNA_ID=CAMNT_0023106913 /DNA_START=17 /DNA_END=1075 /DNA_ORIENTATION=-